MKPSIPPYGSWKVNEINVKVFSSHRGFISYEKFEINADQHYIDVKLNLIDRLRGITLEEKMIDKLSKLKARLIRENDQLARLRAMRDRILKGVARHEHPRRTPPQ